MQNAAVLYIKHNKFLIMKYLKRVICYIKMFLPYMLMERMQAKTVYVEQAKQICG